MPKLWWQAFIIIVSLSNYAVSGATFWQISDIHYDFYYSADAKDLTKTCPSSNPIPSLDPGPWGDFKCDSNFKLINSSIYAMKSIEPNPDFILWTGDNPLHTSEQEKYLSEKLVLEVIANLTLLIKEAFPTTQVYSALGNHDYYPKNQMPEEPGVFLNDIAMFWEDWLIGEQYSTFIKSGYSSSLINSAPNLRIIVLNTNLWDNWNLNVDGTGDPGEQFRWFENQLNSSRNEGKHVFIIGHIAPGFFEKVVNETYFHSEYNKKYAELIHNYSDVINGQFFGHQHCDSFKIIYVDQKPVSAIYHAPSIAPKIGNRDGPVNPGIRLFQYERSTAKLLDYAQYYLDLEAANSGTNANWRFEYNATTAYDLADIGPESLHKLAMELKRSKAKECSRYLDGCEHDKLQKYSLYNTVSKQLKFCNSSCQRNYVCAMIGVEYDLYQECLITWNGGSSSKGFQYNYIISFYSILTLLFFIHI